MSTDKSKYEFLGEDVRARILKAWESAGLLSHEDLMLATEEAVHEHLQALRTKSLADPNDQAVRDMLTILRDNTTLGQRLAEELKKDESSHIRLMDILFSTTVEAEFDQLGSDNDIDSESLDDYDEAAISATIVQAEREMFESDAEEMDYDIRRSNIPTDNPSAEYKDPDTGHRWAGWLARAEIEGPPPSDNFVGWALVDKDQNIVPSHPTIYPISPDVIGSGPAMLRQKADQQNPAGAPHQWAPLSVTAWE